MATIKIFTILKRICNYKKTMISILKKKNKKLQKQNKLISKQAYKWFQQKKAYKEKYQKMKALHTAQANVETLLQAAEVAEEQ